nr:transcription initiation factor TAFII31, histone-fold protein [Tanacetum cinerariifolium]
MHDPREPHFSALKRILRYVRGTLSYGLQLYSSTTSTLVAYSDADWAGCPTTPTLVYCDNVSAVYFSSNPVQHQRTNHIEIDIHFVRDLVSTGLDLLTDAQRYSSHAYKGTIDIADVQLAIESKRYLNVTQPPSLEVLEAAMTTSTTAVPRPPSEGTSLPPESDMLISSKDLDELADKQKQDENAPARTGDSRGFAFDRYKYADEAQKAFTSIRLKTSIVC